MSYFRVRTIAGAVALALISGAASAVDVTTTFAVSATVVPACTVSATPLSFGSFANLVTPVDATNTVTVNCASGTTWSAGIDLGTGAGATLTSRKLTSGANLLDYNIFPTAARIEALGGFSSGGLILSGTGTGVDDVQTLYGRVFTSATTPPAGTYTDTITVTVRF